MIIGGAIAAAYGLSWWVKRPTFDFHDMSNPPGFRRLALGATSGGDIFFGLGGSDEAEAEPIPKDQICEALFEGNPSGTGVRIASFSDYNCAYCRVLTREIHQIEHQADVTVTWHELPLLGPTSETGARLAIAAGMQGAYEPVHRRLMGGRFVPTEGFTAAIAREFQLDAGRLAADQRGQEVEDHLANARALAQTFGIIGTPALVVGRTLVIGNISPRQLGELIKIEARERGLVCR